MTDPTPAEALKAGDPRCVKCNKRRSDHNYFHGFGYLCHNGSNTFLAETPVPRPPAADAGEGQAPSPTFEEGGWQPIETAPHACCVIATRFDRDAGEWDYAVVLSPPSKPFTHWRPLPAPPAAAIRGLGS